jgi:hypothetical protein
MPATTPGTVNQLGIRRDLQSQTAATHVSASVSIQTVVRESIRLFVFPIPFLYFAWFALVPFL